MSWDICDGARSSRGGDQTATVWEWELEHRYQPEGGVVRIVIGHDVQRAADLSPESRLAVVSRGRTAIEKYRRARRLPALIRVTVDGLQTEGIAR